MELIPWILLGILLLEHIVFLPALFERAGLNKSHLRKDKEGGGKIELNFKDATELDNLLNLLGL